MAKLVEVDAQFHHVRILERNSQFVPPLIRQPSVKWEIVLAACKGKLICGREQKYAARLQCGMHASNTALPMFDVLKNRRRDDHIVSVISYSALLDIAQFAANLHSISLA